MIVTPVRPVSGLTLRNAFQCAAIKMTGKVRYATISAESYGESHFHSAPNGKVSLVTHEGGDSALIENEKGKRIRIWLVHPRRDDELYEQFEILAQGVPREFEFHELSAFISPLSEFIYHMNERILAWVRSEAEAAA